METRAAASEKKVLEITEELNDIERGHLDKNLHQEASKSLQKRVKSINEELQKLLEGLDSIQLAEDQLGDNFKFYISIDLNIISKLVRCESEEEKYSYENQPSYG